MQAEAKKIFWLFMRSLLEFLFMLLIWNIFMKLIGISTKNDLSTNQALMYIFSVFGVCCYLFVSFVVNLVKAIDLFRSNFRYNLKSSLKRWYSEIYWDQVASIGLGVFLTLTGLIMVYSGVLDIRHFFYCQDFLYSSYMHSAFLSVASTVGLIFGGAMFIIGSLLIIKKGKF